MKLILRPSWIRGGGLGAGRFADLIRLHGTAWHSMALLMGKHGVWFGLLDVQYFGVVLNGVLVHSCITIALHVYGYHTVLYNDSRHGL